MLQIVAFAGSLRRASIHRGLLRAAKRLAPADVQVEIVGLEGVPLFNQDVEGEGVPEPVARLKAAIEHADAVLIACPEYNLGVTGVLKNAIDWLSRPPGRSCLRGKPTAIIGASPGRAGASHSQLMLRQVLVAVSARVLPSPLLFVAGAGDLFQDGELDDEATEKRLAHVVEALRDWARIASVP